MLLYKAKIVLFQWQSIYQSQIMTEAVMQYLMGHNFSMTATCLKFFEHFEHLNDKEGDQRSRGRFIILRTHGACSLLVSVRLKKNYLTVTRLRSGNTVRIRPIYVQCRSRKSDLRRDHFKSVKNNLQGKTKFLYSTNLF